MRTHYYIFNAKPNEQKKNTTKKSELFKGWIKEISTKCQIIAFVTNTKYKMNRTSAFYPDIVALCIVQVEIG